MLDKVTIDLIQFETCKYLYKVVVYLYGADFYNDYIDVNCSYTFC